MKLFVDDIRPAPEGWQQARTVTDAIKCLAHFAESIEEISLDHDISYAVEVAGMQRPFPSPESFQAVAYFIAVLYGQVEKKPAITIHTANPVGARELENILNTFPTRTEPAPRVNRLESEV